MSHRISEATRYTVYYQAPAGSTKAPVPFECTAPDRGSAIQQLAKHLGSLDFNVIRAVPGWPEKSKEKKQ